MGYIIKVGENERMKLVRSGSKGRRGGDSFSYVSKVCVARE
jgi:hypothetical protein